jgi:hypothetical protein
MKRRRAAKAIALGALLAGCAANPFVDLGPLSDDDVLRILRQRTDCRSELAAELVIGYTGPDRQGTFDATALFTPPSTMQISAYKDLIFATEPIFDMTFTADEFDIEVRVERDQPPQKDRGPAAEFPRRQPRYRGFYWGREAFVLPGAIADDGAEVLVAADGATTVATRLHSGARVTWRVDRRTLEVQQCQLAAPEGAIGTITYSRYFKVGELFVPGRVVFRDDDQRVELDIRVRDVEATAASAPGR